MGMETHEAGIIWTECKINQPRGEHNGHARVFSQLKWDIWRQNTQGEPIFIQLLPKAMDIIIIKELQNERRGSQNATLRKNL